MRPRPPLAVLFLLLGGCPGTGGDCPTEPMDRTITFAGAELDAYFAESGQVLTNLDCETACRYALGPVDNEPHLVTLDTCEVLEREEGTVTVECHGSARYDCH
ncbi:MAG: hypothetical protein KC656_19335 [Myxococcales bacterium]|nr:hypothetical protein [Myxococcales bacterium]MCB9694656.1 hypothetical protein [Alphaproteobacteria bacterium]